MKTTTTRNAMTMFKLGLCVALAGAVVAARPARPTVVVDAPAIEIVAPAAATAAVFIDAPAIEIVAKGAPSVKAATSSVTPTAALTRVGTEPVVYVEAAPITVRAPAPEPVPVVATLARAQ